ncbi:metal ABC transporter permease [Terasakiella sp. A23]|uniref:metal ABC transporter permease n=1 Tax=Terasakiella sp. FCG-A23 TaxID=3080561 RepID=UPI0029532A80|nr:metal ABC transporter permease [Terasakiella sp. A23]MDV7340500.1 metal ABC transporter permease [Terasakiella sp. A23]
MTTKKEIVMLDDFFFRALIAGIGVALCVGPLGCFVVWRRMAYYGDTMAHSALLGVALSFLFEFSMTLGVFVIALLVSLLLVALQRRRSLPTDSLLGILSHSSLAIGLVLVAFMTWVRIDLEAYLFGDILAVTKTDILLVYLSTFVILTVLAYLWRPLLAATVNEDLALVEGLKPQQSKLVFMVLMAGVVAIAIKIVGVLLITALLIIPAASARRFSTTPEMMAVLAAMIGVLSVVLGLWGSLQYDTPSGPSIVVAAMMLFGVSLIQRRKGKPS